MQHEGQMASVFAGHEMQKGNEVCARCHAQPCYAARSRGIVSPPAGGGKPCEALCVLRNMSVVRLEQAGAVSPCQGTTSALDAAPCLGKIVIALEVQV